MVGGIAGFGEDGPFDDGAFIVAYDGNFISSKELI
jgi:hypothetical protein